MNTLDSAKSFLLIIDVQEKLVNAVNNPDITKNAIITAKAARILNIPVITTEQYPKGLGETVKDLKETLSGCAFFEKTNFSAYSQAEFKKIADGLNRKSAVILGIETHICVLQTAFDMLNAGYEVYINENACASRKLFDKISALKRLENAGAQILTTEQILFEWLKSSTHPDFKAVQALIK